MTYTYKQTKNYSKTKKGVVFNFTWDDGTIGEMEVSLISTPITLTSVTAALNAYCVDVGYPLPLITESMVTL